MVRPGEFRKILAYSVPFIMDNLSSVDFLNNNVQKVDGKTPFYDDATHYARMIKRNTSPRPTIHLKDSWRMTYSVRGKVGIVRLYNSKRSADGKWVIADLLWYGTRDYNINEPDIRITTPILYGDVTAMEYGRSRGFARSALKGKAFSTKIIRGHHTKAMTFYDRYRERWFYNRHFRRGIRNELVVSFRQYILLCVENGIRRALAEMEDKRLLVSIIKDVHVSVSS